MVNLSELCGLHYLTGLDFLDDGDQKHISFGVDGTYYTATIEPVDSYNSICVVSIAGRPCQRSIELPVFLTMQDRGIYGRGDNVLRALNIRNGREIFAVGTEDLDSNEPSGIIRIDPTNLDCKT